MFTVIGISLVSLVYESTHEQIKQNEYNALLKNLNKLVGAKLFDNDLVNDVFQYSIGGRQETLFRARYHQQPVAVIFNTIAVDGYNGAIHLLVAIRYDHETLLGVRVIKHKETPGLGDGIDDKKSHWIHQFDQQSLTQTPLSKWRVKKDGGDFDQLTGATITPRAIIKAVKRCLVYFKQNKAQIFKMDTDTDKDTVKVK